MLGRWSPWHATGRQRAPYGDATTYALGAAFLDDCAMVEDWGCGLGWFSTYRPPGTCRGVDGTPGPSVDVIADLTAYQSSTEGVFVRHVLEHNHDWAAILDRAVSSCTRRFALVLFVPPGDALRQVGFSRDVGVPDLSLPAAEIEARLRPFHRTRLVIRTATQYGEETCYFATRPPAHHPTVLRALGDLRSAALVSAEFRAAAGE